MKRPLHPISLLILTASVMLGLSACNLGAPETSTNPNDAGAGTIVAATSSIATSTPSTTGNMLPSGTLILTQLGNAIAQPPNAGGTTIALKPEQFGNQASLNGRYGVRIVRTGDTADLFVVDFSTTDATGKEVPQGKGLSGPGVTWKADSSGFAFYDFPAPGKTAKGNILFYDVNSGQTSELVPTPGTAGSVAGAIAFSPDAKYLAYAVGSTSGEGVTGPGSKMFLFDTGSKQSTPLPDTAANFNQWASDSQNFIAQRFGLNTNNQVLVFSVSNVNSPKTGTPANTNDFIADISPDGKFIAVTTAPATQEPQPAQIAIMGIDGSNRKTLTQFTDPNQSLTGLVWGADGIYYSITSAENVDTTWRMDLDGKNAAQIAQGTLNAIVGSR